MQIPDGEARTNVTEGVMKSMSVLTFATVMMRNSVPLLLLIILCEAGYAQKEGDYTVGIQADLVKTDNIAFFEKAQFGAEVSYFMKNKISGTVGFELWTADEISFLLGGRWYPSEEAFVRARALIGENDVSIGGGWTKPLSDRFKFEAIGDFYFKVDFSIRVGIFYIITRND